MKTSWCTWLAVLPRLGALASRESLLHSPRHMHLHERRTHTEVSNKSTSLLRTREDYTCGAGNPCGNGACCGVSGYCGYGPTYCGDGCTSNCDAVAECGEFSESGEETCPLNTCCSEFGFCGTIEDFCSDGCQSNCDLEPEPPSGSSTGQTLSKVIGYWEAWNDNSDCHAMSPTDLPLDVLTHLNYAFAYLDADTFKITTMDARTPASTFADFASVKITNPNIKLFVSIGGWTFSDNGTYTQPIFGNIASSSSNRQKFADNMVTFLDAYGFDGIDIDWEYPGAGDRGGREEDTKNYVEMLKTLRETFDDSGRELGITFTAPSSYWYLKWFDLPGLMKYADWVNLMSYDLHGTWDSTNPIGSIVQAHTNLTEIKLATELFWRVEIPPHKIALGFGFYGRAFTLQNPSCTVPGCPFSGGADPGSCTATSGYLAYYEIQDILNENPDIKVIHDEDAAVKYFTWGDDQWISYDDADTFKQKIEWADNIGFSGALIWASDLDDYSFTAHAALLGKDVDEVYNGLSIRTMTNNQQNTLEVNAYLTEDCYKSNTGFCNVGDEEVGYDRDGSSGDHMPICCPENSGLKNCQWRGGNGGTNAGRDCNGQCHAGEVLLDQSDYGGSPGESSDTAKCTRGKKAFCCEMGIFTDLLSDCSWTDGNGNTCGSDQQKLAYMWNHNGWATTFSHGSEYCCPKDQPAPLLDCRWVGTGDCADNTCGGSEITLLTDDQGDSWAGCSWYRKKSLCCTVNPEAIETMSCDYDLCSEEGYDCDDEVGPVEDDDDSAIVSKRSYKTGDGRTLWSYDYVPGDEHMPAEERAAVNVRPGDPRSMVVSLEHVLNAAIYSGKHVVLTSRPYWAGLKSLYGDGKNTLVLRGGFSLLKDSCMSTAMQYTPAAGLPKTGYNLEHVREVNMISAFVSSLVSGKKVSGKAMTQLFNPMDILNGWNKVYDVTLPRIGEVVTDTGGLLYPFTEPLTPNDRIFEAIGSYAYRTGLSFLRKDINLGKYHILTGHQLGGSLARFKPLFKQVYQDGDMKEATKIGTNMQTIIGVFNYLNDAHLQVGFVEAGKALAKEMTYADQYIPELKGIAAAWAEWEPDYWQYAVDTSVKWFDDRVEHMLQTVPGGASLGNEALDSPPALKAHRLRRLVFYSNTQVDSMACSAMRRGAHRGFTAHTAHRQITAPLLGAQSGLPVLRFGPKSFRESSSHRGVGKPDDFRVVYTRGIHIPPGSTPTTNFEPPDDDKALARITSKMTCPEFRDSRWGFAIYRCTEGNDAAWNRMLQTIRDCLAEQLNQREDLLQYHDLHVIDDKAL
ncbi:hypothetical protein JX266_012996 [Neoarthrinium moseri]|nr:hypothetical protein JX266_012996 [Neoarthrinium moseri]